jgi:hypothetical protein
VSSLIPQPPALPAPVPGDDLAVTLRDVLIARLVTQAERAFIYEAYYNGSHPLVFTTSKWREAFGMLFAEFADNWCQLIVDAAVERLKVVGFTVGGDASAEAWSVWQDNALDSESVVAHTEAGKLGHCFLLVDPNDGEPKITIEHPTQVVVLTDPADRRNRIAALKHWIGADRLRYVTLYLPDLIVKWESKVTVDEETASAPVEWIERDDGGTNPLGAVPVIPLENKPGLLGPPHSDLEPAIPLQNAVNKLCSDMIVASEYAAFPQRAITGVDVPKDPETGQVNVELKAALSRVWTFKAADAKVWNLPAADLGNYVTAVEMVIQHLAAQTRTPPHYLLAKLVNTSGEALAVAEAGLVSKVKAKTLFYSDAWEEAIALALSATGAEVEQADCEALWEDPERVSEGQRVDAAVKKKTLGIPLPVIWAELGYTPEQVAEMEKLLKSQEEAALEAAAAAEAAQERVTAQLGPEEQPPEGGTPPAPPPTATGPQGQPPTTT